MILLLVVIYVTFISLGLPDSLFGVTWPLVHLEFSVPESFGSIYSIIIALTTGGVSFFAGGLIRKFGTGKVTVVSVLLTAISLIGISFSPNIIVMLFFSVLGGLGAGAIDTGLNNFVSLKYNAIHMNWLHCFWGVGVSASPLIMSFFLNDGNWRTGYAVIGIIQSVITFIVFLSLILWKKYDIPTQPQESALKENVNNSQKTTLKNIIKTKGMFCAILSVGFYCSMEFLLGTWGASYLVNARSFSADLASMYVSVYYGGIMLGRFFSGLISLKMKDRNIIRCGIICCGCGILILFMPWEITTLIAFLLIGIGFGPVFPSSLHAVPDRFGSEKSADITGYIMGGGYVVGYCSQIIFGYTATGITFDIMPFYLIAFWILLLTFSEFTNQKTRKNYK